MSKDTKFLDYNTLIRDNLLNVVKHALGKTSDYGLTDGHHFYITFITNFKENILPSYLVKDYPDNMMIVIENEFWNLKVFDNYFLVDLKFKGKIETLKIMFNSLISFVDPSVSFNLNLDLLSRKKHVSKTIKIQQKQKARIENKSNIIYLKPKKIKWFLKINYQIFFILMMIKLIMKKFLMQNLIKLKVKNKNYLFINQKTF